MKTTLFVITMIINGVNAKECQSYSESGCFITNMLLFGIIGILLSLLQTENRKRQYEEEEYEGDTEEEEDPDTEEEVEDEDEQDNSVGDFTSTLVNAIHGNSVATKRSSKRLKKKNK